MRSIEEIRALCDAIECTGDWWFDLDKQLCPGIECEHPPEDKHWLLFLVDKTGSDKPLNPIVLAVINFIEAGRTLVPEMLKEIERLEAEKVVLVDVLEGYLRVSTG